MRIKFFYLMALPISFVIGLCLQAMWLALPSISSQHESERATIKLSSDFNVSGCYYPIEQPAWLFGSIERIDIITADYELGSDNSVRQISIKPKIYFWAGDVYQTSNLSLSDGQISFATKSSWGISYQFTGEILEGYFPIQGYSGYFNGMTIMLKGKLIKELLGFKIAESEMSFTRGLGE